MDNISIISTRKSISHDKVALTYEIGISVLAVIAVIASVVELSYSSRILKIIDLIILAVFAVDYFVRFILSRDKKQFAKENIFDLIAIIPISPAFRGLRMVKLIKVIKINKTLRIFRVFAFSKKVHQNTKKFLKTNGFIYMIYLTIGVILLGSCLLYIVEQGNVVKTFEDAIWLSFLTATQFGYEGVENLSTSGKIIESILIIIGILFAGMFTATATTFFMKKKSSNSVTIEERVIDLSDLKADQFREVMNYINYIRRDRT